jgi:predicted enzyme related to lactoylglutathione lyase
MGERIATMGATVINVIDLERAKAFWSQLLGVEIATELPGFAWLHSQHKGGPRVALQQVDDPTPGRNRVHIDTGVADLDEAQKKIESLGGSYLEEHEFPGISWRVMADPEGNEFCIGVQRER